MRCVCEGGGTFAGITVAKATKTQPGARALLADLSQPSPLSRAQLASGVSIEAFLGGFFTEEGLAILLRVPAEQARGPPFPPPHPPSFFPPPSLRSDSREPRPL